MENISKEERLAKINQWFNEKAKKPLVCEICGHTNWGVEESMGTPIIIENNNFLVGGKTLPQIILICNHCGNIKYFSAIKMGLLNNDDNQHAAK